MTMDSSHIKDDVYWMKQALLCAKQAEEANEIPVGAVLVRDNQIIAKGWNQMITLNDPSAHAEIMAIRAAGEHIQNYRLLDTTLYVTLEPCIMCAGALIHARITRLVFGARDYKTGASGSFIDIFHQPGLNHYIDVASGILAEECSLQLSQFFKRRRDEKKLARQSKLQINDYPS